MLFFSFFFLSSSDWSVVRLIKVIKTNKHIQKSSIEVIIIFKRFCLNSSWQPLTQLCQSYLKALRVRACAYIYTRFELEWIKTSQINTTFSSYFQCCNDLEISSGSHKSDTACVKLNGSYPALFERAHLVPEQKKKQQHFVPSGNWTLTCIPQSWKAFTAWLWPFWYIYIKQPYQVLIPCDKNLPKKYSSHLKLSYTAVTLKNWAGH